MPVIYLRRILTKGVGLDFRIHRVPAVAVARVRDWFSKKMKYNLYLVR